MVPVDTCQSVYVILHLEQTEAIARMFSLVRQVNSDITVWLLIGASRSSRVEQGERAPIIWVVLGCAWRNQLKIESNLKLVQFTALLTNEKNWIIAVTWSRTTACLFN